jgi:hypothetical protein
MDRQATATSRNPVRDVLSIAREAFAGCSSVRSDLFRNVSRSTMIRSLLTEFRSAQSPADYRQVIPNGIAAWEERLADTITQTRAQS